MSGDFSPNTIQTKPKADTNLSPFGDMRVSERKTIWEHKNTIHKGTDSWHESKAIGATITHDPANAWVDLSIGQNQNDFALRQSSFVAPYTSGKGSMSIKTFRFNPAKTGLTQRVMYGDMFNGCAFELVDSIASFVKYKNGVETERATQDNWSIDKLDEQGESKILLDLSKVQLVFIDFAYLAVGVIRCGFQIDEVTLLDVHHFKHANQDTEPYWSNPTLPIRYEIRNHGATASPSSLKEICSQVSIDGGDLPSGFKRSAETDFATRIPVTNAVLKPILAIRLKTHLNVGYPNRGLVVIKKLSVFADTNPAKFSIGHVHGAYATTATFNSLGADSIVEYSTDINTTGFTGGNVHEFGHTPIQASKDGGSAFPEETKLDKHSFIVQNLDSTLSEMFVVYAIGGESQASEVYAALDFLEII
jgi:hypothetical protein